MGESSGARDASSQPEFFGAALLKGESPREVLRKLTDGDPLELRARCEAQLRERALLVALERAFAKALAVTARKAMSYRGEPALDAWLAQNVAHALDDALLEDRDGGGDARHYEFVARVWDMQPDVAQRACGAFNGLPRAVRAAYWALAIEGKTLRRLVAEGHGPPKLAEARVERALITLGTLRDPGGEDLAEELNS